MDKDITYIERKYPKETMEGQYKCHIEQFRTVNYEIWELLTCIGTKCRKHFVMYSFDMPLKFPF